MIRKIGFLISGLFFIILLGFITPGDVSATVIISEFSSASSSEWIELLNTDQNGSVSLTNYTIVNGSDTTLKILSGTLPKTGFLTFTFDAGSLENSGGIIRVKDGSGNSVNAVSYGTDTSLTTITAPSSTQSAYYNLDESTWNTGSGTTITKGWCNPGTGSCPTIATITSSMSSNGVNTNLGSQADLSRTTGLYFQKSETNDPDGPAMGKITFLSEINFTDRDALSWMETLGTSIDMSTRGRIGLNADLIANLVSTNASLTMYGLTLGNPSIQVTNTDGSAGDSSIVSSIVYSGGTLTFTAAHFTVFTAVETTTSSSSGAPISKKSCSDEPPDHSPELFQINTNSKSATLYFTPVNNAVSYYYISYGFPDWNERFGVVFPQGRYGGVLSYTVNHLAPNTKYDFKVRAGNGCSPGKWSNVLPVKTDGIIAYK